jgi:hypothetical protein
MYKLDLTLNEPNDAENLVLRVGDSPLLELTVYNHDGTAWPDGYDATLRIGRSNRDPDIWSIAGTPSGSSVNVWYFQLEDVTYTIGDYDAILYLQHPAEATPGDDATVLDPDTTPVEDAFDSELDYSFLPIPVEVR